MLSQALLTHYADLPGGNLETHHLTPGHIPAYEAHVHTHYQFCFNPDEAGGYELAGRATPYARARLFVVPPLRPHRPLPRRLDRDNRFLVLNVTAAEVARFAENVAVRLPDTTFAQPAVLTAYRELFGATTPADAVDTFLAHLPWRGVGAAPASDPAAVGRARQYLTHHLDRRVSLTELAAHCYCSKYHLCRVFREAVGVPPLRYHRQLRAEEARRRLVTGASVGEVSLALGYHDPSHLRRQFRTVFGLPPSAYQKAQ